MAMQNRKQNECLGYQAYLIWNAIRMLTVGIIIYFANHYHSNDLEDIQGDCCKCVQIAHDTSSYNATQDRRFDLSYCIPTCTSCDYCKNNDYPTLDSCPATDPDYTQKTRPLHIWLTTTLNDAMGCANNISITSLYLFQKSFESYGIYAVIAGSIYATAMIILLCKWKDRYDTISIFIFIYNICLSELFCYWLFKPYQYHREYIVENEANEGAVQCQVDLISDTVETMLSAIIFTSFGLLFLQLLYCILSCCKCVKKACCLWSHGDSRRSTITSHLIDDTNATRCDKDCCCYYIWIVIGCLLVVILISFAVALVWGFVIMIEAAISKNWEARKIWFIVVVNVLLILSLFDIFFFPFCRKHIGKFVWREVQRRISSFSSLNNEDDQF